MVKKSTPPAGPEFSKDRDFRAFGGGLADVQNKVSEIPEISERLEKIEQNVSTIKTALPNLSQRVSVLEKSLR